jgi:signal transduction histidine kinase/ActR/RegA family two-component response regulator
VQLRRARWALQQKAWIITTGVLVALAVLVAWGVDAVFREGSAELEEQWIAETVRRVNAAQTAEIDALERGCRDYANWLETYTFIDDPSMPYVETNLLPSMFANLRLDAFLLFHLDSRLRLGRTYDGTEVSEEGVEELFAALQPIARHAVTGRSIRGLLKINQQIAMVAVLPVVHDDGSGPPNGALGEVRILSASWQQRLRDMLNVDIVLLDGPSTQEGTRSDDADSGGFSRTAVSDKVMELQIPLIDLNGRRIGAWKVTLERKINLQGIRARLVFYVVLGVLVMAAAALIGALLRWMVIARLEALQSAVSRVGATSDLSVRLPMSGSDELTSLTDGINRMLQALADAEGRRVAAEAARERLTTQLQESQKLEAIGTLAAGLAHDFNNLITSIQGSATLIRLDSVPEPEVESHLQRIEQASKRAAGLVQKMTAFGRRSPTVFEEVRLSTMVSDAFELVRPSVPSGIQFKLHNEEINDWVAADPAQLQQALVNLATNASHAMASGRGSLSATISRRQIPDASHPETSALAPGDYLRLVVEDEGCGIAPEHLTRVFEPFYTTKPVGSGTGLGLAVVHGIVGHHRGSIGIESQVGKGTRVIIHLPCAQRAPVMSIESSASKAPIMTRSDRKRLLLVDDDSLVRSTIEAGLARMGYEVCTAQGGAHALQLVEADPDRFDVLVTDQMMPGMTGLELGQEIAKVRPTLPCILISGYAAALNERQVKALGFAGLIMKPVTLDQLDKTLQSALSVPVS